VFQNLGPLQILVVLFVILLLFGVGKLPQVGRGMGQAINEFKNAVGSKEEEDSPSDDSAKPAEPNVG
jgi:sec-independent protein translocase protein TatA